MDCVEAESLPRVTPMVIKSCQESSSDFYQDFYHIDIVDETLYIAIQW